MNMGRPAPEPMNTASKPCSSISSSMEMVRPYQIISNTSALPAVCGRVCPQETQCEMYCVRGKKGDPVGIGRLERFVARRLVQSLFLGVAQGHLLEVLIPDVGVLGGRVRGKKGDPVGIGRLERFVADWHNAHCTEAPEKPASNGHRVAVVGSGPAGLTCAGLRDMYHDGAALHAGAVLAV